MLVNVQEIAGKWFREQWSRDQVRR